jgi:hypothetical protein
MLNPNRSATAKAKTLAVAKRPFAPVASISDPARLEMRIRERAHQLYENRGRIPGGEKQDWAQAERELSKQG